jgi:hypothetical protein
MVVERMKLWKLAMIPALAAFVWTPQPLQAAEHIVSAEDVHRQLLSAQAERQADEAEIGRFLQSEGSRSVPGGYARKIEKAVPFLSDEETARLASQVRQIERDVAAGALSNEHLTYIVIALAAAVVVLIAK